MRSKALLYAAALIAVAAACSTQKNTPGSRWWHSFNAKYNTYYNGETAYKEGELEKENANKDNFTELIPLYAVTNKASRETGKANFQRAVEKSEKAIQLHSIKKKPEWDKSRRKTDKDREWLSRREYNPFLWKAWLLMGKAQFHSGGFEEAAATFSYMSRLYQGQPAIYAKARAWLAKCYVEEGWLYDAEDVIRNMGRDSIHWSARREWDYTLADYHLHAGNHKEAAEYLRKVVKHEKRKKQKAREWFLIGQLEAKDGNSEEAYKAFGKAIRQNPPYEVEFNARIAQTEVLAKGAGKKMAARLKRMAASDKNKDYLDQVYYALGNIHLSMRDTAAAISAYEKGSEKGTRNGVEKGALLLKLGDIYWDKGEYGDAQRCYSQAVGMVDKDRADYDTLATRSKMLDELAPHTESVHLQDSLQQLARMGEKERNEAIDRVIEALKKKEKEERDAQAEAYARETVAKNSTMDTHSGTQPQPLPGTNTGGAWYFYNPTAVQQGKSSFQKLWGKRQNADFWRYAAGAAQVGAGSENAGGDLPGDSIAADTAEEADTTAVGEQADTAQNDPHRREYYLAQIPFTPEQVAESNSIMAEGLFNAGVIFKDKFGDTALAGEYLGRLVAQHPDFPRMDDAYYHMFLLHSRKGEHAEADRYLQKLKEEYPQSRWTGILADPYFKENAQLGEHIEDSLYSSAYEAFKAGDYAAVHSAARVSQDRFPQGANRDKFMFINALSSLNGGDVQGCIAELDSISAKFPAGKIGVMAKAITEGVKAGKRITTAEGLRIDPAAQLAAAQAADSAAAPKFSAETETAYEYVVVAAKDSMDANKALFHIAKHNFTNYMVRNFDIAVETTDTTTSVAVSGFQNHEEARQYAEQLHSDAAAREFLSKARTFTISKDNRKLIGRPFSYADYETFYREHLSKMATSPIPLLLEPEAGATPQEGQGTEESGTTDGQGTETPYGMSIEVPVEEEGTDDGTTTIETGPTEDAIGVEEGGITLPAKEKEAEEEDGGITLEEEAEREPADDGVTFEDNTAEEEKEEDTDIIVIE